MLARNLVVGKAEIDLLALTPNQKTLVVIEVKTTDSQSASSDATLMQRVDARKQQLLKQAAVALVRRHRLQGKNIRFDIITVKPRSPHGWQITHIPAAFT